MNEQIFGVFDSIENTERALSALKDHGVEDAEVSVVRADGRGAAALENEADHGFTVTGPADVVAGAMKGGAAGLALGVLAGAVALTVPGIGPILAAGPIAAALGAVAFTTAAGAISGGVVGYLVDQGVPEAAAIRYSDHLAKGHVLVGVRSSHISPADAIMLLQKYGALSTELHPVGTVPAATEPGIVDENLEEEEGLAAREPISIVRP